MSATKLRGRDRQETSVTESFTIGADYISR
jgi:hypothetical protein